MLAKLVIFIAVAEAFLTTNVLVRPIKVSYLQNQKSNITEMRIYANRAPIRKETINNVLLDIILNKTLIKSIYMLNTNDKFIFEYEDNRKVACSIYYNEDLHNIKLAIRTILKKVPIKIISDKRVFDNYNSNLYCDT